MRPRFSVEKVGIDGGGIAPEVLPLPADDCAASRIVMSNIIVAVNKTVFVFRIVMGACLFAQSILLRCRKSPFRRHNKRFLHTWPYPAESAHGRESSSFMTSSVWMMTRGARRTGLLPMDISPWRRTSFTGASISHVSARRCKTIGPAADAPLTTSRQHAPG